MSAIMCACTRCMLVTDEDSLGFDNGAGISYCSYCGSPCDLVFEDEVTEEEWREIIEDMEWV